MRPFHLAFPVVSLKQTENFYTNTLGCIIGRRTPESINFNFYGHQIVAHLVEQMPNFRQNGNVDGKQVPPFHFGIVMEWEQWHHLRDRLIAENVDFRIKPHTRYPGKIGEQATMFIDDPSGNSLEFKSFSDDSRLFATVAGNEKEIGGGLK
ncbi:MAG: VOC family protein [Candidatus Poseidoniaceae archaeon]|nr:VOC family protein [Candidatus Poseidoniaceae archaeon]